jgi:hypothetical protein
MKKGVFWDVAPFTSCKNLLFGRMYRLHHQGNKNHLFTANDVRISLVFHTDNVRDTFH